MNDDRSDVGKRVDSMRCGYTDANNRFDIYWGTSPEDFGTPGFYPEEWLWVLRDNRYVKVSKAECACGSNEVRYDETGQVVCEDCGIVHMSEPPLRPSKERAKQLNNDASNNYRYD